MRAYPLWLAAASVVATLAASSLALAQSAHLPSRPASSAHGQIAAYVSEASQRFGVPEAWIVSVMRVESAGDPTATSSAGAMGLMQVMPATYATLRARLGLGANAYDPHDNIMAGAAYLRELHDRYVGVGFLAAYNAGPGRWEDHLAGVRPLPPETVRYITQLTPMLDQHDANTLALAISRAVVTPESAPIFVTLRTKSVKPVSVPCHAAAHPTRSGRYYWRTAGRPTIPRTRTCSRTVVQRTQRKQRHGTLSFPAKCSNDRCSANITVAKPALRVANDVFGASAVIACRLVASTCAVSCFRALPGYDCATLRSGGLSQQ